MLPNAFRYAILAVLLVCAYGVRGGNSWQYIRILQNPALFPEAPLPIQMATRTIGGGPLFGNQILAIDGKPFNAYRQFEESWSAKRPGEKLVLTLSAPDGHSFEEAVAIHSRASRE